MFINPEQFFSNNFIGRYNMYREPPWFNIEVVTQLHVASSLPMVFLQTLLNNDSEPSVLADSKRITWKMD
jgi:hypothetical protein